MNPITLRKKARRAVMQALYQWQLTQNPTADIEADILSQEGAMDRDYFQEIFAGVMAELQDIDILLATHTSRPLDEISPIEYAILRSSAYELLHRLDIPYKVVINEALDMSKEYGANEAHKFVNGILDKIAHDARKQEIRHAQ
jgi:N utilization substance protein B